MKKNKKGFTLVELIIVIAIIGVLSAILIPTMINYVRKSKIRSSNANAKLIFTIAKQSAIDYAADGNAIHDFAAWGDPKTIGDSLSDKYEKYVCGQIKDILAQNSEKRGSVAFRIDDKSFVGYAQWTDDIGVKPNDTKLIIGQYPNPPSDYEQAQKIVFAQPKTNP